MTNSENLTKEKNIKNTARISSVHRDDDYRAFLNNKEIICRLPGNFYARNDYGENLPAVGDYVIVDENRIITEILPRKNTIARKSSGSIKSKDQIIAANIDLAFIVTSLNQEFNPRRIERYLAFLDFWGVESCLILTKSDLCSDEDLKTFLKSTEEFSIAHKPIITSIINQDGKNGLDEIAKLLTPEKTAVFMGMSEVGKSSIINYLLDENIQEISETSDYMDKGRHTTTHRKLFIMKNNAAIIDSPGMRELAFGSGFGELSSSFDDIETLAANCKFRDCRHRSEPECAVQAAIKRGLLNADRLNSWRKMHREVRNAQHRDRIKEKSMNKNRAKHQISKSKRFSRGKVNVEV
ncbi:MAG: ribosome small subunit-dependent GTPase A [Defluviitaleaceae bacterium]|nr:ribosome small subunit-dependent GTPase A [Defluviitaleaceae bacterium]